ncbi:MAG: type II secretion system F family protein [bacterium]|nr:type II secretion system F family protein [bacterium]
MQFVCRYGTSEGHILTQVQEGTDAGMVRRELERQGFYIFEIRPRGLPIKIEWPFLRRRKRLPAQEFLAFNQELAALLRAGLPLMQALDLMLERMEDPNMREVLTEVRDRVASGEELSDAFAHFGDRFPPLYSATLKAGERSGELEQVLRRFIRYLRLVISARKQVISALVYPAVLIGLSFAMLVVMAIYVVPQFSKFYSDLDAELPLITRITLAVSFWLRDNILWVLGGLIVAAFALRTWRHTPAGRLFISRVRLRLPILGIIFLYFSLSEFCRSLATLLAGGIPLVSAFETAVKAIGNAFIGDRIEPAIGKVREGQAFWEAIDSTGVFPFLAIDMIKVGEATGSLDEMLGSVSEYFDEKVETRMQRLLSLVEPIMLIIMGMIIAVILVSIYLPMFSAFGQVGT